MVQTQAPDLMANGASFALRYLIKRVRFGLRLSGSRPAITYAAYRTASTAVHHAIRSAGLGVASKAHMLAPANLVRCVAQRQRFAHASTAIPKSCHVGDWAVRLGIIEPRREADFVIMVRDPWAVAHSIFVLSAPRVHPEFSVEGMRASDHASLVHRAESIIFERFPRDLMIRWMQDDAAEALAWSPLDAAFDAEAGSGTSEHGPWRILVLRSDVPDERKSTALGDFFGRLRIKVIPKNGSLGQSAASPRLADIAREAIARRPDVVAATYETQFCRHYWTDRDRAAMVQRWSVR